MDKRKRAIESHMHAEMHWALANFEEHESLLMCKKHKCPINDVNDLCEHLSHFHDYDTEVIEDIPLLIK